MRFDASNIGDQGSAAAAQENAWYFPQNPVGAYFAFYKDALSLNPNWFYRPGPMALPFQPNPFQMSPVGFVIAQIGNSFNDCEVPCPGCPDQRMADIVAEQNEFAGLTSDELYFLKYSVYEQLRSDTSLMYAGYPSDLILKQFYDSASNSNMEMLLIVNDLIADSLALFANAVNSWISPINHFEDNMKVINDIYINTWAVGIYTFNQEQMDLLSQIANENPLIGGYAVYTARVMLGLDFADFINSNLRHLPNEVSSNKYKSFQIYPNPARNRLYINYQFEKNENATIELIDLTGKTKCYISIDSSTEIDISHLTNGVYMVKFSVDNNQTVNKVVVLNK
ncbi:MAG: T9SS type A sorting domain-containing protein [Bacteroidetes bacterium]|nr:T9SS type A sorting domain-containing protein [Bacteroidota bacterium]